MDADGDAVLGSGPVSEEAAAHLKRVLEAYELRRSKRQCAQQLGEDAVKAANAVAAAVQVSPQRA